MEDKKRVQPALSPLPTKAEEKHQNQENKHEKDKSPKKQQPHQLGEVPSAEEKFK